MKINEKDKDKILKKLFDKYVPRKGWKKTTMVCFECKGKGCKSCYNIGYVVGEMQIKISTSNGFTNQEIKRLKKMFQKYSIVRD